MATQERFTPQMWQPTFENGAEVLAALRARDCTLRVSPTGRLLVEPNDARLDPLRPAIQAHLPYLLLRAALQEVAEMLRPLSGQPVPAVDPGTVARLYSITEQTAMAAARAAVVAYLEAWRRRLAALEVKEGAHGVDR